MIIAAIAGQAGLALPEAKGAWTVHVVARGGFAGDVSLDLALASDGKIECVMPQTPCPKQPDLTKLSPIIEALPDQSIAVTQPAPAVCNDCLTRSIVIRHRDSTGMVRSYTAQWSDINRSRVLPQLLQIYDAVIALQIAIGR
jgi:hypothetical protein